MRTVLILAALLAVSQAVAGRELLEGSVGSAIVGGKPSKADRWQWMASLHYNSPVPAGNGVDYLEQFCGGVLVHPRVVLTAASCIFNNTVLSSFGFVFPKIVLNCANRNGTGTAADGDGCGELYNVTATMYHRRFNFLDGLPSFDIAMMLLDRKAPRPPLRRWPTLPGQNNSMPLPAGTLLNVLGFGETGKGQPPSPVLLQTDMRLQDRATCQAAWSGFPAWNTNRYVCATYPGHNKNICPKDFGGPLFLPGTDGNPNSDVLIGIGSATACNKKTPAVFTNINNFRIWIQNGIQVLVGNQELTATDNFLVWVASQWSGAA